MRIRKLHLKAFGPFTNRILDFGGAAQGLVLIHGPNEAGKSSALRAISDLRFGIPPQSKDNFVHSHPNMRIGGEFVDRQGQRYSFIRRKRRTGTLLFADFDRIDTDAEKVVPVELEATLTGGLTQDAYDSMFGLDHRRLREGGEALLKGEGEVGAALFEASAGVRSIGDVLTRLDDSARRFFMPGTRGKNARINEALGAYDARQTELRQAQVRPLQWTDLFKKQQATAETLRKLESRQIETSGKMQLIKELRAVAPLLSTLDNGLQVLAELTTTTLLATTAPAERAAAESGLADALQNAKEAADELKRHAERLEKLELDDAILALMPAVKRLATFSDTIDQHRRDMADARTDVETEEAQITALAAQIAPELTVDEVVKRAPTKTARVTMEKLLRDLERAQQALQEQSQAGWRDAEAEKGALDDRPSPEVKTALRIAEAEVARAHTVLEQLSALPGEIKAVERASAQALAAANLADEAAMRRARPLMNGQIDAAQGENHANAMRREALVARIDQIAGALSEAMRERDQLLAQGSVATRDDVEEARSHRDSGWAFVRATYIDGTPPDTTGYGDGVPLPEAYERAVTRADQLIDELAGDQERAARLQSSNTAIRTLEGDRDSLQREIEAIDQRRKSWQAGWEETLAGAGLPPLSPVALRDWQALLPGILQSLEKLQSKRDELDSIQDVEKGLTAQLRTALLATGLANPSETASLRTLTATAHDVAETIRRREEAIQQAAGREVERERQRLRHGIRQRQLSQGLEVARKLAEESFRDLLLPVDADVSVAWARLAEFDDLANTVVRRNAAQAKKRRAEQTLAVLVDSARAIWESLGDHEPPDLRLYAEHLASRLEVAETVQSERALAMQAAESARSRQGSHENTADRHRQTLADLCRAAGVESAALLPEAEDRSRRKREAQEAVDRSRTQLAAASRRPAEELRTLLAQREPAQMDADEFDYTQVLAEIDGELPKARERAEQARRELEAIDSSDTAAAAREGMESAASSVRAHMPCWIRSKIAHGLLGEALKRFRERAQGPMLSAASRYFERMTCGEFVRLISDDSGKEPVLIAERRNGPGIKVEEMSEGTRDQLYLALRLAALDLRRSAGIDLPVVLDDVLMASDEERSAAMLEALAEFGGKNQVIVFTHHRHIADMAVQRIPSDKMALVAL